MTVNGPVKDMAGHPSIHLKKLWGKGVVGRWGGVGEGGKTKID